MNKILSLLFGCALMVGCWVERNDYTISSPDAMEPEKRTAVAINNTSGAVHILWSATGGRFEGPVDAVTAIFVAPEKGTVTLICSVKTPGGKSVALTKQIAIGGSATGAANTPAAPNAPAVLHVRSGMATPINIDNAGFIPAGFMGDRQGLRLNVAFIVNPHSAPTCTMVGYSPTQGATDSWAAVAWQHGGMNFGEKPGKNWSGLGLRRVSVWARGIKDNSSQSFPKVQFKAGGATAPDKPNQASFEVSGDFVTLTGDWKQYTLDLTGSDLSRVISAFVVVIRAQDVGPKGATFYLDDIEYQ